MDHTDDQDATKECPCCLETMHLRVRDVSVRIPGTSQIVKHRLKQWECQDCSYEEEFEEEE